MPDKAGQMKSEETITAKGYAGLFLVTLSTLMLEILLTRIFSVTMWYHFAFMAISIAMFGMTVGAVTVYLLPRVFSAQRAKLQLARYALCFAAASVLALITHLHVPFNPAMTLSGLLSLSVTFASLSLPFFFSGICVTIALTRFPSRISRLYAADLAGAAVGSFLLFLTLGILDGPNSVVFVAFLASTGALFFALEAEEKRRRWIYLLICLFFMGTVGINARFQHLQSAVFPVRWVKGIREPKLAYEKWSSYARVAVRERAFLVPLGWGLSDRCPVKGPVKQLYMDIDATAGTVLTQFSGSFDSLQYLMWDITNLVHYLRRNARILIVGTGGGRDILSALAFGQKTVLGVEINGDIIHAVNKRFGDFTGHLDRIPGVSFVNDEARSYLTRSKDRYDIIQISLIDTWSATAAGAYVLCENSLYTTDAWKVFIDRLSDNGILSVSRWFTRSMPAEMYRLTSLAVTALREAGVRDPRRHIIIARNLMGKFGYNLGIGTLLLGRRPFRSEDIAAVKEVCSRTGFEAVLTPEAAVDPAFVSLTSEADAPRFVSSFPLNITPPTDDSPFFFNMLRVGRAFNTRAWTQSGNLSSNLKAVLILGKLLIIILMLVIICIVLPLLVTSRQVSFRGTLPYFLFFCGIGVGFMLVEISQMQRLCVFLGHPSYGLTVVLFSLLLAGSIGSYLTRGIRAESGFRPASIIFLLLLVVLFAFGKLTPLVMGAFSGARTPLRILMAVGLLFPQGIMMGTAFPLGMTFASVQAPRLTPWFWGMNGAMSVFASVLAVVIALNWGIAVSYWTGLAGYAAAFAALGLMARRADKIRL